MIYFIAKNSHYCTPRKLISSKKGMALTGSFRLGESCWYDTKLVGTHLNKLIGFSTDLFNLNSVRIAWRPSVVQNQFEVYIYIHLNGAWVRSYPMKEDKVATVDTSTQFFTISVPDANAPGFLARLFGASASEQAATVVIGSAEVVRSYPVQIGTGWMCYPYFGGKPVAPHDMAVEVDWVWE